MLIGAGVNIKNCFKYFICHHDITIFLVCIKKNDISIYLLCILSFEYNNEIFIYTYEMNLLKNL